MPTEKDPNQVPPFRRPILPLATGKGDRIDGRRSRAGTTNPYPAKGFVIDSDRTANVITPAGAVRNRFRVQAASGASRAINRAESAAGVASTTVSA